MTRLDFSRSPAFGCVGQMFVGEVGSGAPVNAPGVVPAGYQVTRVNPATGEAAPLFAARPARLGPPGPLAHVTTAGPKRPVGVKFSPDGKSLYVVDIGAIAAAPAGFGPFVRAFPGSGVVWRITPAGQAPTGPPAGLSPLPPKSPLADAPSAPAGHAVVAGH